MGTLFVFTILACGVGIAIYSLRKNKKNGCHGSCSGCGGNCHH